MTRLLSLPRGALYESVDRQQRSTSYCDPPKMMVPPVPKQRTSMLAASNTTPAAAAPNVADIVTKFNQNPHLKLMKSASVISSTSTSSSTTTGYVEGTNGGGGGAVAADSHIHPMLPPIQLPASSSPSTSSKDSSAYSQTLPHKTKSQSSGLAKLEKIYQTIYSGTLRRNKSQRKEKPENVPTINLDQDPNLDSQEVPVVKKREKAALKYRHSCSNQDEAVYVAAKKFGAKKRKERNRRQYHSMNETIEVLADQVIEDDELVSPKLFLSSCVFYYLPLSPCK